MFTQNPPADSTYRVEATMSQDDWDENAEWLSDRTVPVAITVAVLACLVAPLIVLI